MGNLIKVGSHRVYLPRHTVLTAEEADGARAVPQWQRVDLQPRVGVDSAGYLVARSYDYGKFVGTCLLYTSDAADE